MKPGVTHLARNRDQERGIKKADLGRKRGEEYTYRLISGEQRVSTLKPIEQDNLCPSCSNDSYYRRGRSSSLEDDGEPLYFTLSQEVSLSRHSLSSG